MDGRTATTSLPARRAGLPVGEDHRERDAGAFAHRCGCALLLSGTVLQKVAVPGTGGTESSIPISMVALFAVIAAAVLRGVLLIDGPRLAAYLLFTASATLSFILSDSLRVSLSSWIFVLVMQTAFVFRFAEGRFDTERTLRFVADLAALFAALGIAQFFLQFVVGRALAFPVEHFLPGTVLMSGFNMLNPLTWNSPVLKSNGVFFAEPSFFCQFLAIGIIVELLRAARPLRLALLGFGVVCSYSGTGLLTLGLFLPWYVVSRRRYDLLALGGIGLLVLLPLSEALQLSALTSRAGEFTTEGSSGFARFVSIFYVLGQFIFGDLPTLLLGRGPGTVQEYFGRIGFEAFDPTWGKILYEYGLIGAVLYAVLFVRSVAAGRRELLVPLAFTYFFLGGYLVNASIIIQLAVLVSWPALVREGPRAGG